MCSKGGLACSDATSTNQELCNGKDDDCDEEVDEGFGQVDEPCDGPDIDFCKNGLWTCAPDGHGVVCQDDYPGDLVELCNGKDDNCNLSIDEDWADQLGQPCDTDDRDKCAYGTWVCADHGRGVVCEGDSPSDIVELCNGEDDDCDGETDEGYDLGGLCDRHDDQDSCSHGYLTCDPDDPKALACLDDTPITNSEKITNNSFEEGSKDWIVIDAGIDPAVLHRDHTELEPRTGDWLMVLGGQNAWTTRVRQIIDVPESNTMLKLSFYWRIVTEDSSLTDYDALRVQLLDIANANIFNVLDVSNLDASDEWAYVEIDFPLAYAGQIVQVEFRGATDQTGVSWFLVDDVSLTARHCDD